MRLTPQERETIILYNEADSDANIYTYNVKLIKKLEQLAAEYPDKVILRNKDEYGAVSYIVAKSCVCIRPPYSEERRKKDSKRVKAAGIKPPIRNNSILTDK